MAPSATVPGMGRAEDEPAPVAPGGGRAGGQHREVLRLAVPAFLALVAEPLFLLSDAAIVGRLGVAPLAGLGVASAVLLTAANVFVFLAYGTTAVVARQLGAGSRSGAISAGIDGTWLAVGLGDRHGGGRRARGRPRVPGVRRLGRRPRRRGHLPADLGARHPGDARRPRDDRCPAGAAGHPDPARRRRRGLRLEHRPQPLVRPRAALGHRGLGLGHGHRPDRDGRRPGRRPRPARRPRRRRPARPPRAGSSPPRAVGCRSSCAPSPCAPSSS